MATDSAACHCGRPVTGNGDGWQDRVMPDMCNPCRSARCDTWDGECPPTDPQGSAAGMSSDDFDDMDELCGLTTTAASDPVVVGFMREWSRHENALRTTCSECHFESSEGYPPSHAPGCSQEINRD